MMFIHKVKRLSHLQFICSNPYGVLWPVAILRAGILMQPPNYFLRLLSFGLSFDSAWLDFFFFFFIPIQLITLHGGGPEDARRGYLKYCVAQMPW